MAKRETKKITVLKNGFVSNEASRFYPMGKHTFISYILVLFFISSSIKNSLKKKKLTSRGIEFCSLD